MAKAHEGCRGEVRHSACRYCMHYRVSWDPRRPYGCAAHGFKSAANPAQVVYEASGIPCQLFMPKERRTRVTGPEH